MEWLNYIKVIVVFIVTIGLTAIITHNYWLGTIHGSQYKTDTVYIHHTVYARMDPEIKFIERKDSVNLDSLWHEALTYAEEKIKKERKDSAAAAISQYSFYAVKDTCLSDSSICAEVAFYSPIPLHPKSFFTLYMNYKEKTITRSIPQELTFFDRFKISLNLSPGYGFINKKADIFIGFGFSFVY